MPTGNPKDWELKEISSGKYRWIKKGLSDEKTNINNVIIDTMDAKVHPITGKLMDSKSEFRKVTREHNCVEVGNEQMKDSRVLDLPPLKEDIARAIRELEG